MDFQSFNKKVIEEISNKKDLDNSDNKSGIYAIYIDNFDYTKMKYKECIIPIYVGQSKDLYKRMMEHKRKLKSIFSCSKNEFNENLRMKKESQYLYHKIRKCINETKNKQENIKFIVLEYCEEDKLIEREKYYIDLYKTESFGLNQLSSIQKIVTSDVNNDTEGEIINILDSIIQDIKKVILDKDNNYGFSLFNASMLCYNSHVFLGKMEKKERSPKTLIKYSENVILKFNETLDYYGKLVEETCMFFEPGIPDFIGECLKIEE